MDALSSIKERIKQTVQENESRIEQIKELITIREKLNEPTAQAKTRLHTLIQRNKQLKESIQ